jgi:hypothetical protein
MKESILKGKRILAVDDEPDVLTVLEEKILEVCPNCRFDKTTSYATAIDRLKSKTYDVVILDIMGVRGFDLLRLAVNRNFKVPGWKRLFEKLKGFFDDGFESDWEKKTGLEWTQWHKWE